MGGNDKLKVCFYIVSVQHSRHCRRRRRPVVVVVVLLLLLVVVG